MAHGEWTKWCESIGMRARHANKFIVIYDQLRDKWSTSTTIGFEPLYQIATMPEAEREQPHTIPSTGETKVVDEMTVRELREVKDRVSDGIHLRGVKPDTRTILLSFLTKLLSFK